MVPPDLFIGLAEETGLINEIGEWVLYCASRQMKQWKDTGLPIERMAINVSPVQITSGRLVELVEDVLKQTELEPSSLELEVTEAIFMDELDYSKQVLNSLEELGVQLALDDFGTGFSSLSYLKHFRFDHVKIDRSFIQDVQKKDDDGSLANSIIALGHSLDMSVLAEGIETEFQLRWLREKGCNEGQGYLFSKPVSEKEFEQLMFHSDQTNN